MVGDLRKLDWKTIIAFVIWFIGSIICYVIVRKWFSKDGRHERNMFVFCVACGPVCLCMIGLSLIFELIKKLWRGNGDDC